MYELLWKNIEMHITLDPEEKDLFIEVVNTQKIKNKSSMLKAGHACRSIYFVNKGCLRIYYTDSDGDEHTVLFCPENWWATDIASFSAQKPALFSIGAIEETEVFSVTFESLEKLYSQIPKFERFFRILTQNGYGIQQRRIVSYLSKSAKERYELFQKEYPKLEQRISQKHIASYVGITPVFLSRLRKQI
jgi:CRP-like cAMP-binding protein